MTNLHELFVEASADAPPSRLSVEDVYSASRAQRRLGQLRTALAAMAAVVTVAAGGIMLIGNAAPHPPAGADPPWSVVWADRGDASHLYVVRNICGSDPSTSSSPGPTPPPVGACHELLASSDGGATWVTRDTAPVDNGPRVLGPLTLMRYAGTDLTPSPSGATDPAMSYEVSTDGGVTWSQLPAEGEPVEAMPPGVRLINDFGRDLKIFDPVRGRLRALAHQPTVRGAWHDAVAIGSTDIWVAGVSETTGRPAVAVSHDAGATWIERDLPGTAQVPQPTPMDGGGYVRFSTGEALIIPRDGTTAYVTRYDGTAEPAERLPGTEGFGWLRTYRTTDGGLTWQPVAPGSTTPSYYRAWIAADGRIVAALGPREVDGVVRDRYAVSTDGINWTPAEPPGLPTSVSGIDGSVAFSNDAVYLSDDGWNWQQVRPS